MRLSFPNRETDPIPHPRLALLAALLIIALGLAVRIIPWTGFQKAGYDEMLYQNTIVRLDHVGLQNFPALCDLYIEEQSAPDATAKLPPTRFLYIFSSWVIKRAVFGDAPPVSYHDPKFTQKDPALRAMRFTSALFSCLFFVAGGFFATRMLGPSIGLGVLALMATSPIQIHMAQHGLVDGFFAFWATLCLWLLWENLQRPRHTGWLIAYGTTLALLVLTKENAFFVYVGLCGVVAINAWAGLGTVTRGLLATMLVGPLAGVAILVNLAGGLDCLIQIYQLLVTQAEALTYAIRTGDGPWHRYLVDLMIVTPLVLCLAIGGLFTSVKGSRPLLFLVAFTAFTYAIMCNVRYGMNLRYTTIWELPLCALAMAQISRISLGLGRRGPFVATLIVIGLCAYGLRQYSIFFVDAKLYELVSEGLLRAVRILK